MLDLPPKDAKLVTGDFMLKVYNVRVNGYEATGRVSTENDDMDVDVEFSVYFEDGMAMVDIVEVYGWDGHSMFDLTEKVDLELLADEILERGDLVSWEEDNLGNQIDAAHDFMDMER